jgi:hypothetical protein
MYKLVSRLALFMELEHPSVSATSNLPLRLMDVNLYSYTGYLVPIPYISKAREALWTTRFVGS